MRPWWASAFSSSILSGEDGTAHGRELESHLKPESADEGMQISQCVPTIEALMALEDATFGGTPLAFTREDYEHELAVPGVIIVSAYDGGEFLGFAGGTPDLSMLGRKERKVTPAGTVYFWNLGVFPQHQGKGIAQALADERARIAMKQGYVFGAGHYREGASEHIARKYLDVIAEFDCPGHSKDGTRYTYLVGRLRRP
jgi:ribosomal protein S18 acetylase RimI-like enzyme